MTSAAVRGEDVDVPGQVRRPHDVEHHVGTAAVGGGPHLLDEVLLLVVDRRRRRRAPRQRCSFSSLPAVTQIVAEGRSARTIWIAIVPMPLLPPWMRIVSPSASCPVVKTLL